MELLAISYSVTERGFRTRGFDFCLIEELFSLASSSSSASAAALISVVVWDFMEDMEVPRMDWDCRESARLFPD